MHLGSTITTFKYLETYRFGIQFQHRTGKWSEPIWIKDVENTVQPYTTSVGQ
nr:MAG TPA: stabilization protein [Crassvirales sp.]